MTGRAVDDAGDGSRRDEAPRRGEPPAGRPRRRWRLRFVAIWGAVGLVLSIGAMLATSWRFAPLQPVTLARRMDVFSVRFEGRTYNVFVAEHPGGSDRLIDDGAGTTLSLGIPPPAWWPGPVIEATPHAIQWIVVERGWPLPAARCVIVEDSLRPGRGVPDIRGGRWIGGPRPGAPPVRGGVGRMPMAIPLQPIGLGLLANTAILGLVAAVLGAGVGWLWRTRSRSRRRAGRCVGCGYDLVGIRSDRCPECGRPRATPGAS